MKIINSKIFKLLVALFILGIILGIISFIILDKSNSNIINYFNLIKNGSFNYEIGLLNSIKYNFKYEFIIWICGFLTIFVFIIPLLVIFRGISACFTLITIIYTFKLKGFLLCLILLLPCMLLNEGIFLITSYYSLNFSFRTINVIKNNKLINVKNYSKNYIFQLLIFLGILFISSLFEIYITSNILKSVL